MAEHIANPESEGPSGGWGSVKSIARIYGENTPPPSVVETLFRQNKPHGFMCVSCAWPKPKNYHPFEFCENGAKATLSDLTSERCTPDFWNNHTVSELREWKISISRKRGGSPTLSATIMAPTAMSKSHGKKRSKRLGAR
jgi:hypothetical protein